MTGNTSYALVVGAVNVDICGRPFSQPAMGDSNPGRVSYSFGGVGRNISHNLRLLDVPVKFLTALSGDEHSFEIKRSCDELGIDLQYAVTLPEKHTSTYLYITDKSGEMILAVCDADVSDCITPEYLKSRLEVINSASIVIFDSNLTPESISWLCDNCTAPLFADPVSAAKAPKLKPSLGKIHTLKPNKIEAELLTGIKITDTPSMENAVSSLLSTGLRRVFLSLGADGVYCADSAQRRHLPIMEYPFVNTTGGGDTFMAALAWSYIRGMDMLESAKAGLAAASVALESESAINPNLNAQLILSRMCGK